MEALVREQAGLQTKENVDPKHASRLSVAREHRREHQKAATDYKEQQDELANHHLLLCQAVGIIMHYGETPSEALRLVSVMLKASYATLHTL